MQLTNMSFIQLFNKKLKNTWKKYIPCVISPFGLAFKNGILKLGVKSRE